MITINNLDFSYKNVAVFRNISLEFKEGCVYGLLGENGVGKTTLLKLMSGLQSPVNGTVSTEMISERPKTKSRYRQEHSTMVSKVISCV